ncbi:hypothetical protein GW17_00012633 [Ensete ventricosum]|nr:hypothetical protein GW17_00012633 [Ensete ventricosum]
MYDESAVSEHNGAAVEARVSTSNETPTRGIRDWYRCQSYKTANLETKTPQLPVTSSVEVRRQDDGQLSPTGLFVTRFPDLTDDHRIRRKVDLGPQHICWAYFG